MTPKEYTERLEALKEQETKLAQDFIKDNPFKELEGKIVKVRIGYSIQKVLFVGSGYTKDTFEPALIYHKLKKDGTPRIHADWISVRFYDDKNYKIEKIG